MTEPIEAGIRGLMHQFREFLVALRPCRDRAIPIRPRKLGVVEKAALAHLLVVNGDSITDIALLEKPVKAKSWRRWSPRGGTRLRRSNFSRRS
jgi:hypothetical protein